MKKHIVILSPALAIANNGNWQTASRWARMLRPYYRLSVASSTASFREIGQPDLVIALHARRSAQALAAIAAGLPAVPIILVLTGTDLYRDIRTDPAAQHSLAMADRLVVLQDAGLEELPPAFRKKTQVIYQSAPTLKPIDMETKRRMRRFEVCMIGHLRPEKDPATFMHAVALLDDPRIRLTHIGSGRQDSGLARLARQTQKRHGCYRWLGDMPHSATRQLLKRSHLMVLSSTMEGGANVVIEAVTSGVPVLASDISGNRGMLGRSYAGYFPVGDSASLARAIGRAASDDSYYGRLHVQCQARAPLFSPEHERAALLDLVDNTLHQTKRKERRP